MRRGGGRLQPGGGQAVAPKLAALILKTGTVDEELADNLTEVLISRLARRGDHEIAGKEELKTKLGVDDRAAADCMSNPGCLGRVGTELGVTRMVVGTLGKRGDDYVYNLNLIDIETGQASKTASSSWSPAARCSRSSPRCSRPPTSCSSRRSSPARCV